MSDPFFSLEARFFVGFCTIFDIYLGAKKAPHCINYKKCCDKTIGKTWRSFKTPAARDVHCPTQVGISFREFLRINH